MPKFVGCGTCGRRFVVSGAPASGFVKCLGCGALVPARGEPRPCGLAKAALAFSLMTLVGGFVSGTTVLAWIAGGATGASLGRNALRRIKESDNRLGGAGYAQAAVIIGRIQCLGSIVIIVALMLYLHFAIAGVREALGPMR